MSAGEMLVHKRRVVYTALSDFLAGEELDRALVLWERRYADRPLFALNEYVGKLGEFEALNGRRKDVVRRLLNLSQSPGGLLPDPGSRARKNTADKKPSQAAYPERLDRVFEHFLVALESVSSNEVFLPLRLDFLVRLGDMPLNATLKKRLRQWFDSDGEDRSFSVVCSAAEIRRVINQLYVVMCELMGPVRADDLLEATVLWLERYHPQSLPQVRRFL